MLYSALQVGWQVEPRNTIGSLHTHNFKLGPEPANQPVFVLAEQSGGGGGGGRFPARAGQMKEKQQFAAPCYVAGFIGGSPEACWQGSSELIQSGQSLNGQLEGGVARCKQTWASFFQCSERYTESRSVSGAVERCVYWTSGSPVSYKLDQQDRLEVMY